MYSVAPHLSLNTIPKFVIYIRPKFDVGIKYCLINLSTMLR